MYFVISKIFFFLVQPLNWVVAILLGGLLCRNPRLRKHLIVSGVAALVILTNPFVLDVVLRWWEPELVTVASLEEPYDLGIVLGGYSQVIEGHGDRLHLGGSPNRLVNALELYQAGKIQKFLLSGGSSRLVGRKETDADQVRTFLIHSGVREGDVIVEAASRNTHENASLSAGLIRENFPGARCLLLTSAVHMRRAEACFRKEGIAVDIFPTDPRAERGGTPVPVRLLIPEATALADWESLAREWAGFVVYRLQGFL